MYANPIIQKFNNFILYLLFWICVTLLYIFLLNTTAGINFTNAVADGIVFNLLLAGLGLGIWYSARFISFETTKFYKFFSSHILGGILFTILWLSSGFYILKSFFELTDLYTNFFWDTLSWRFLIGILFYFLLTSFYYVIIYYSGFQERSVKEAELKNLVMAAELKSLKFQINPHFIFNSLNSMSALTTTDPEKAREMILKLADFLRYTLANNDRQKNPLREELRNIRLYLDMEKIRFEDKFEFTEEVSDKCLNTAVPNMILQPLFENAIKHAVYETLDKVNIILKCKQDEEYLAISVENNFDQESNTRPGAGVGLKNIQNRLRLIYNRDNLVNIKKENDSFKVTLFIPNDNDKAMATQS